MQIIMGLIGMVVLLAIAVLLSSNRKAINLRTVLGAWIIQVGIGALILYVRRMRQKTPDWSYASQTLSGVFCCLPT